MSKTSKITEIFLDFFKNYPRHFLLLFILLILEGVIAAGTVLSVVPLADYLIDPTLSNPSRVTKFAINYLSFFGIELDFWLVGVQWVCLSVLKVGSILKLKIETAAKFSRYTLLPSIYLVELDNFSSKFLTGQVLHFLY